MKKVKKISKKVMLSGVIVSIMLAAACLESAFSVKAQTMTDENLVMNGDFETDNGEMDVTGWTPGEMEIEREILTEDIMTDGGFDSGNVGFSAVGGTGEVSLYTEEENQMLKITSNSAQTYTIGKGGIKAEAGTTYTISYKVKKEGVTKGQIRTVIVERGGTQTTTVEGERTTAQAGTWVEQVQQVTAKEGVASWDLRFAVDTEASTFYVDDIKITYISEIKDKTVVVEHVINGTFDEEKLNWEAVSEANGSVALENGEMKLDISNSAGFIVSCKDRILITPGTEYTFSYEMRGIDSENTRVLPRIIQRNENGGSIGKDVNYNPDTRKPSAKSQKVTLTYTPDASAVYAELRFLVNNGTGTVWLDHISLTSVRPMYGDGITQNGSGYEMKVSDGNSAVYHDVTLVPNAWYHFSYDVRKDESLESAGFKVGSDMKQTLSGIFKYQEGQEIGFGTKGTGEAYFDNLVIRQVTESEERISNGAFQQFASDGSYRDWFNFQNAVINPSTKLDSGIDIEGDNCGIQTTGTMLGDSTYILSMDAAVTGSGMARLYVIGDKQQEYLLYNAQTPLESRYLITPSGSRSHTIRFRIWNASAEETITFSLGKVSLVQNRGDFDQDNDVEADDFKVLLKGLLGAETITEFHDLTADGQSSVQDLVRMRQYMAGLR